MLATFLAIVSAVLSLLVQYQKEAAETQQENEGQAAAYLRVLNDQKATLDQASAARAAAAKANADAAVTGIDPGLSDPFRRD